MQDNIVWTSTFDDRYTVTVTRAGPYEGDLTISEGSLLLYREAVGLMYDGRFGPDVVDIIDWKRITMDFIDGRNSSSR